MENYLIKYTFELIEGVEPERQKSCTEIVEFENIQQATEYAEQYKNRVSDCTGFNIERTEI